MHYLLVRSCVFDIFYLVIFRQDYKDSLHFKKKIDFKICEVYRSVLLNYLYSISMWVKLKLRLRNIVYQYSIPSFTRLKRQGN